MKTLQRQPSRHQTPDQRGMAAIVITMITMVVISLIVIGFATISRREQRQTQDQLLSSQAFYAAESGIEDARSIIKAALADNEPIKPKDNCNANNAGPGDNYPTGAATVVNPAYDASYTCLKVDPEPDTLQYNGVADNSIIVPITTDQPTDSLEVSWRPTGQTSGTPSADCPNSLNSSFSPQAGWTCDYGVLRMDIVPTAGNLTRTSMANGQLTAFFQPRNTSGGGTLTYPGNAGQPNIVSADCTSGSYVECKATISNLGLTSFSLRLSSIYQPSRLTIAALDGTTRQGISGVQAIIDSTGKASDVLRRIQVRMPLINTASIAPNYAIQSNSSLCKRFATTADSFRIPGDIVNPDNSNAMCRPTSDGDVPPPPSQCTVDNDIILVLDKSGSMAAEWETGTAMQRLQEVARRFVQITDIDTDRNNAGIVAFSTTATTGVELTGNRGQLISYINSLTPEGDTYYLTGLDRGTTEVNSGRSGTQKVIVFVSDGAPENGDDGKQPESHSAIRAKTTDMKTNDGIIIYTVGIDGQTYAQPNDPFNEQLLQDMSSGPSYYSNVNSEAQLNTALEKISSDLRCL